MFTFTVKPDGGDEYSATATSRDVVVWEKTGRNRSVGKLAESPAMGDLYALAHLASKRLGLFDGTFKEFEESVDLEFEEDEASDPT